MKKRLSRKMNEMAVSPIISTVLLIMIVIVLAAIILLWARGFIREAVLKEIGGEKKTVEQFCSEVSLEPILNADNTFGVKNKGNVPIFAINLKLEEETTGSSEIIKIDSNLNPGVNLILKQEDGTAYSYLDYENVKAIPILLGKTKEGAVNEFPCPEENGIAI